MNAVLGYDQPLTTEKLSTVDILELGEVSPQLRIVRLDSNELVALACFKPSFNIKIKPNDHIHLGNAYYTISLPETNLKCYYRWNGANLRFLKMDSYSLYRWLTWTEYLSSGFGFGSFELSLTKFSLSACEPAITNVGSNSVISFSVRIGLKVDRMCKIVLVRRLNTSVSEVSPSWNSADCKINSTSSAISRDVTRVPWACLVSRWFCTLSKGHAFGFSRWSLLSWSNPTWE
ncbi:hypothetical protein OGAPHI_000015 [Ogataea philodendri]|uniref:Uncharacterized protein n=1 Tax=Ogataea philodendri TaxID=1378263 RepID=A0A9P8PI71_9ASCO|nr:uncharacterized protein OGAPHI_000015 [Ogataea philodendri]KAH3671829.1 hypothetical protein OGAPHI_000015 [Ogataea philodendri]